MRLLNKTSSDSFCWNHLPGVRHRAGISSIGSNKRKYRMAEPPGPNNLMEYTPPELVYACYADILGFSAKTTQDFNGAAETYRELVGRWRLQRELYPDVRLRIYSDALLLTTGDLGRLIQAAQTLSFVCLLANVLIRGGISYGMHIEVSEAGNFYVLSEALVRAVEIEKNIKHPCIAIDPKIAIPPGWWADGVRNIERGILKYEGLTIVNPTNVMWGVSAGTRAAILAEQYPEYADKYHWFYQLVQAVLKDEMPLVPGGKPTVQPTNVH